VKLVGGSLRVDLFTSTGQDGGKLVGLLALEPACDAYRIKARLALDNARVDLLSYGDDREFWPPMSVHFELSGQGRSAREVMAGLNGYAAVDEGSGRLNNSILNLVAADVIIELVEMLNPFRKNAPYTELECGVLVAVVKDGRVTLEPLAAQTDKVTIVGHGKINLQNEKLDFMWAAKPRKGFGVSASAITNRYLKLGGTLAEPALEVDPIGAATKTGAALATAGLSIVARGMWDRVTAERKVCKHARERLDEIAAEFERADAD
jgi:hypothetical protein